MASDSTGGPRLGSEEVWHALLHDLRGCLGGMKATLDLRDDGDGLTPRDAMRLDTGAKEGLLLVELARMMAFGPWPSDEGEPADAWKRALEPELSAMAATFRTTSQVEWVGGGPWPGPLLRSFTLSLARLVLPQVAPDPLLLRGESDGASCRLRLSPVLAPPLALQTSGDCRDLHGLWVQAVARRYAMTVLHEGDTLELTIPVQSVGFRR